VNISKRIFSMIFVLIVISAIFTFTSPVWAAESYLWPVPATTNVTQYFSGTHTAIDIGAVIGDTIVATKSGTVYKAFTGCNNVDGARLSSCSSSICTPMENNVSSIMSTLKL
jgi:hypothetical protein